MCAHYSTHCCASFEATPLDGIIAAMKLSALGEFGLIGLIKDAVQSTRQPSSDASRRVIIDIGDDTAAWSGSEMVQLATTDSLIEGVHFQFRWCTWEDLGHKSLAVNLSDIAAMGGLARFALVSLSCPPDVDSDSVLEYYRGMTSLAMKHDVVIVGGNLTSSPVVTSTVCVIGETYQEQLMLRTAARPGHAIAVTGVLGGAAAALSLLSRGTEPGVRVPDVLLRALARPYARLSESRILAEEGVRCAIDISDGLLSDLGHVCESSGVSATIHAEQVPSCSGYDGVPDDCTMFALAGGEDYELLFTCDPALIPQVAGRLECPVTVIGEVIARTDAPPIVVLDRNGAPLPTSRSGWRHFAQ